MKSKRLLITAWLLLIASCVNLVAMAVETDDSKTSYTDGTMIINFLDAGAKSFDMTYEEWKASDSFASEKYYNYEVLQSIGKQFEKRDKILYPEARLVVPQGNYYGEGAHALFDFHRADAEYPNMWENVTVDFEEGAFAESSQRCMWIDSSIKGLTINNFKGKGNFEIPAGSQNLEVCFTGETIVEGGMYIQPSSVSVIETLRSISEQSSAEEFNSALEILASDENRSNIVFENLVLKNGFTVFAFINGMEIKKFTAINPVAVPLNFAWTANLRLGEINIPKCGQRNLRMENIYNVYADEIVCGTGPDDTNVPYPIIEVIGSCISEGNLSVRDVIDNITDQNIHFNSVTCYGTPHFTKFNGLSINNLESIGAAVNGAEFLTFANLHIKNARIKNFNKNRDALNVLRGFWMDRGSNVVIDYLDVECKPEIELKGTRFIDCGGIGLQENITNNIMVKEAHLRMNSNITGNIYGIQTGIYAPHNMRMNIIKHVDGAGETDESIPAGWNVENSFSIRGITLRDKVTDEKISGDIPPSFNAELTIINSKADDSGCAVMFAAYDENNKLLGADIEVIDENLINIPDFEENSNSCSYSLKKTVDFKTNINPSSVKIFLWSYPELTPLTPVYSAGGAFTGFTSIEPTVKNDGYTNTVRKNQDNSYTLLYEGSDETVEYTLPENGDPLTDIKTFADGKEISVFDNSDMFILKDGDLYSTDGLDKTVVSISEDNGKISSKILYTSGGTEIAALDYSLEIIGKTLALGMKSDSEVYYYAIPSDGESNNINIPYMPYFVTVDLRDGEFVSVYPDWKNSDASNYNNNTVRYERLSDGSRNKLNERILFTVSSDVEEVFPTIPNEKSPYREELGKRLVIDWWGHYGDRASFKYMDSYVDELYGYGLKDVLFLRHFWQRDGYDTTIPATLPSGEQFGGDAELIPFAQKMNSFGWLFGLHTNYTDYSSAYEYFNENHLVKMSNGKPLPGGVLGGAQNYLLKSSYYQYYIDMYETDIKRIYNTTASFVDVFGARSVGRDTDKDANAYGAGMFKTVEEDSELAMKRVKEIHQGPVISEGGADMAKVSGIVDAMEAQLGENEPVIPNFDLNKLFPLAANQGMGYYCRWRQNIVTDHAMEREVIDKYRAQELAYGHQPFVEDRLPTEIMSEVIKEYYLMLSVKKQFDDSNIYKISYINPDGTESDLSQALKNGYFSTGLGERIKLVYENGCVIYINNQNNVWNAKGKQIPKYGFYVSKDEFSAGSVLLDGKYADYSVDNDAVYFEPRTLKYRYGNVDAKVNVTGISSSGGYARVSFEWRLGEKLPENVNYIGCRIVDESGNAVLNSNFAPSREMKNTENGTYKNYTTFNISSLEAGKKYKIMVYLIDSVNSKNYYLQGNEDFGGEVCAGAMQISESNSVKKAELSSYSQERANIAGTEIDFGKIKTDGAFYAEKSGESWNLTTVPKKNNIKLTFKETKPSVVEILDADGNVIGTVEPENVQGEYVYNLDSYEGESYRLTGNIEWK